MAKKKQEEEESVENTEKYYELSDETVKIFTDIIKSKILTDISFEFIGNDKQKAPIKISKISEQFEYLLGKNVLVSINEVILTDFEDESIQILFEQEIDRVTINEKGKIKLVKYDVNTFSSLIDKYGMDKISKANQLSVLTSEEISRKQKEINFLN